MNVPHKTTVTLPDDLHRAWKAARLPAVEVFRRGLEGTGDTARHAATEARLAQLEARVAQLEARMNAPAADLGTIDVPDLDPEAMQQRYEQTMEARARGWHRTLVERIQPGKQGQRVVTANDAAGAWRTSGTTARDRLHTLTSAGYAVFADDGEVPYRWLIEPGTTTDEG